MLTTTCWSCTVIKTMRDDAVIDLGTTMPLCLEADVEEHDI